MSKLECSLPSNYPWDVVGAELEELKSQLEELRQIIPEQSSILVTHEKAIKELSGRIDRLGSAIKKV